MGCVTVCIVCRVCHYALLQSIGEGKGGEHRNQKLLCGQSVNHISLLGKWVLGFCGLQSHPHACFSWLCPLSLPTSLSSLFPSLTPSLFPPPLLTYMQVDTKASQFHTDKLAAQCSLKKCVGQVLYLKNLTKVRKVCVCARVCM